MSSAREKEEALGQQRAEMIYLGDQLQQALDVPLKRAGLSYVLVVFTPEPPGFARYVSNATRDRLVEALKEFVLRMEQGDEIPDPGEPE